MRNPKERALPNIFSMYFVMLAIYCLDIFAFQSELTIFGDGFFSCFFNFAILFMYIKASKDSLHILGISKKKQKFVAGGVYGALFSLVPLSVVLLTELLYYVLTDISAIQLDFSLLGMNYIRTEGNMTSVTATAVYIVVTLFGSVFKEFFFRGFMLKKMNKAVSFLGANLVQSLLYMLFILPPFARNFIRGYYNSTSAQLTVLIFIFYIIHETLTGVKWGLMTRVSGSTYMATVDHFIYIFLSSSIFIKSRYEAWAFMLHLIAIQLVSLLMVLIYYAVGMKRIRAKNPKKKQKDESHQREAAYREESGTYRVLKEKIEPLEEISPQKFRQFASETSTRSGEAKNSDAPLERSVFIEKAIQEKLTGEDADSDVDDFLKKMTREMRRHEESARSDEITEDFDSDDFLEDYQNSKTHGHHHRHGDRSSYRTKANAKAEFEQDNKKTDESQTTVSVKKKLSKKPKKTLAQKIRSLGGVDDSSSNDLI